MLKAFPLLAISLIVYNILVFVIFGADGIYSFLGRGIDLTLFSGDAWRVTWSDLIVLVTLGLLFAEIMKSAGTTRLSMLNHSLGMVVGIAALIEFLMVKGFASSCYFFLIGMAIIDVLAGFAITIVASRRQMDVIPNATS